MALVLLTPCRILPFCLQEHVAVVDELQSSLQEEQATHAAVREQAGRLKAQVAELQIVEQRYGQLQLQHEETKSKMDKLEQEHLVSDWVS